MKLFTKENCGKCDYVKDNVDLKKAGVVIQVLNKENYLALADLAWYELVNVAETTMPILVLDDDSTITGAIKIKNYLKKIIKTNGSTH